MLPWNVRLRFWQALVTDALWRFVRRTLRVEMAAFVAVTALCWTSGVFRKPVLPYPHAERLVRFHRADHYLSVAEAVVSTALVERARQSGLFEDIATYRILYQWPYGLQASSNLLTMTGGELILGRVPQSSGEAMLSYDCWQNRFDGRSDVLGKMSTLGKGYYRITGVLSKAFSFPTRGICYVAGIPPLAKSAATIARLRAEVDLEQAQTVVQAFSRQLDPDLSSDRIRVSWLLQDTRFAQIAITFQITAITALAGAFLLWRKGRRGWRIHASLAVRVLLACATLIELSYGMGYWLQGRMLTVSLFYQWAFMLLLSAAVFFIIRDHLRRCPHCLAALRMPASFGSWGRIVLDQPATEYACPRGHGLLLVHETSGQRDRWMPLDESWRDLFTAG